MSETNNIVQEGTAVDDVRAVREKLAREHRGDIRAHVEETNRIAEELRARLGVRSAPAQSANSAQCGT